MILCQILSLVIFLLFGCSSVTVSHDYEIGTDFSIYQTFDWVYDQQPPTGDIRVDNPLLDARIRSAVENTLVAKGYRRQTDGQPDMLVAYHLAIRSKIEGNTYRTGIGYGPWPYWGGVGYENSIREYDEGMLVIDIGDAEQNKLIWRGTGARRVTQQSSPKKTTEIVNKTVREILKKFPPEKSR